VRNPKLVPLMAVVAVAMGACSSGGQGNASTSSSDPATTTVPDQSGAPPVTTTVFRAGEGGYSTFRIPAVVAVRDGSLLAFAEGRTSSAADDGNVDLVLKRSSDGGRTWTALQVVSEDGANFVGNPSPVVDQQTGRVVVLATHKNGGDTELQILTGQGQDSSRVWLLTSDDAGANWSAARDITSEVKPPDWRWYTVGPGHAVQLTAGPHTGRLVAAANHTEADKGAGDHVLISDDGGTTWSVGADDTPGPGPIVPDENTAAQLPDGTIVFSSRNQNQDAPWHRLRTTSTDAGSNFSVPYAEQVGLVVPVVQGSLLWAGGAGGRLVFSAPSSPTDRVDLLVRASTDAGVTWSSGTTIAAGPASYSDLVGLPGGRVGDLYETGSSDPYERIDFTVLGEQRVP